MWTTTFGSACYRNPASGTLDLLATLAAADRDQVRSDSKFMIRFKLWHQLTFNYQFNIDKIQSLVLKCEVVGDS